MLRALMVWVSDFDLTCSHTEFLPNVGSFVGAEVGEGVSGVGDPVGAEV